MARGREKGVPNKNRYGSGTLVKNDNGTYSMWRTINGKRYKRTGGSQKEARDKLDQLAADIAAGTYEGRAEKRRKVTVGEYVAEWLTDAMPVDTSGRPLAPASQDRHRAAADYIVELLGDVPLVDLSPAIIADAFAALHRGETKTGRPQSRASIEKVCNTLSKALRRAVALDIIPRNPAADRVNLIPSAAKRSERRSTLTADQARTLLEVLPTYRNGLAHVLSLRLALRPGEAWGLHWSDVADDFTTVNVRRGRAQDGGRTIIRDELKVKSARRTLGVPAEVGALLREHRKTQAVERLAAPRWADDQLVFATDTGRVVVPKSSARMLESACKRADVPVIRPNELRHTCATLLANEGVADEDIAALLGHVDTRMTRAVYTEGRERPVVDVGAQAAWAQP